MSRLSITLIQTNLYWEDKQANLTMLEQKINSMQEPTHIAVLPEMFSTGFSMKPDLLAEDMNGDTVSWMKRVAAENKIILTGSVMIKEGNHFYNRLIWMLPNGQCAWYDKRHLFGYAGEQEHYTAGNKRLIASVNGWKINLQICYDLRFPVWARQAAGQNENEAEYDILIYVANWPERRIHAWRTLLQARAIENQCYVIGVNRVGNDGHQIHHTGNSMVVDPMGEVLYEKAEVEDIFTVSLSKEALEEVRNKLPFLKDRDGFMIQP